MTASAANTLRILALLVLTMGALLLSPASQAWASPSCEPQTTSEAAASCCPDALGGDCGDCAPGCAQGCCQASCPGLQPLLAASRMVKRERTLPSWANAADRTPLSFERLKPPPRG